MSRTFRFINDPFLREEIVFEKVMSVVVEGIVVGGIGKAVNVGDNISCNS